MCLISAQCNLICNSRSNTRKMAATISCGGNAKMRTLLQKIKKEYGCPKYIYPDVKCHTNSCRKVPRARILRCHLNLKCIRVTIATISLLRNSAHSQAKYIPFKDIIIIPSPLKACAKKEIHMGASIVESSLPTDKRFFVSPQGKIDPYLFPHPSIVYSNWRWQ